MLHLLLLLLALLFLHRLLLRALGLLLGLDLLLLGLLLSLLLRPLRLLLGGLLLAHLPLLLKGLSLLLMRLALLLLHGLALLFAHLALLLFLRLALLNLLLALHLVAVLHLLALHLLVTHAVLLCLHVAAGLVLLRLHALLMLLLLHAHALLLLLALRAFALDRLLALPLCALFLFGLVARGVGQSSAWRHRLPRRNDADLWRALALQVADGLVRALLTRYAGVASILVRPLARWRSPAVIIGAAARSGPAVAELVLGQRRQRVRPPLVGIARGLVWHWHGRPAVDAIQVLLACTVRRVPVFAGGEREPGGAWNRWPTTVARVVWALARTPTFKANQSWRINRPRPFTPGHPAPA